MYLARSNKSERTPHTTFSDEALKLFNVFNMFKNRAGLVRPAEDPNTVPFEAPIVKITSDPGASPEFPVLGDLHEVFKC